MENHIHQKNNWKHIHTANKNAIIEGGEGSCLLTPLRGGGFPFVDTNEWGQGVLFVDTIQRVGVPVC